MCIRDRARTPAVKDALRDATQRALEAGVFGVPTWVVDGRAVSYTHLRAHETVLDLVCRLLLEKKKTRRDNLPSTAYYRYTDAPNS